MAASRDLNRKLIYLTETVFRVELFSIADEYDQLKEASEAVRDAAIAEFYKDYSAPTDRKVAKRMLAVCRENVPAEALPALYKTIDEKFGGDIDAYVDNLFDNSVFTSEESLKAAMAADGASEKIAADPASGILEGILGQYHAMSGQIAGIRSLSERGHKAYIAGQLEMNGSKAIYPDANFTMRLTYGNVKSYCPKDGVKYEYYTTLKGVMEKEDPDNWEFVVPAKLKELYAARDFGRYANEKGEMPACFIMTGDITGGNSGSPVLDGDGNLTGLAFDGNWESMSGDIIFEPDLQRCICVDIRYVLFIMDKFGGAGRLIEEMNIIF